MEEEEEEEERPCLVGVLEVGQQQRLRINLRDVMIGALPLAGLLQLIWGVYLHTHTHAHTHTLTITHTHSHPHYHPHTLTL